jgi:hypothetical protein
MIRLTRLESTRGRLESTVDSTESTRVQLESNHSSLEALDTREGYSVRGSTFVSSLY